MLCSNGTCFKIPKVSKHIYTNYVHMTRLPAMLTERTKRLFLTSQVSCLTGITLVPTFVAGQVKKGDVEHRTTTIPNI